MKASTSGSPKRHAVPSSSKAAAIDVRASETQTAGQEAQSRVVCKKRKFGSESEVMKITSNEDVAETVAVSQNPSLPSRYACQTQKIQFVA